MQLDPLKYRIGTYSYPVGRRECRGRTYWETAGCDRRHRVVGGRFSRRDALATMIDGRAELAIVTASWPVKWIRTRPTGGRRSLLQTRSLVAARAVGKSRWSSCGKTAINLLRQLWSTATSTCLLPGIPTVGQERSVPVSSLEMALN